MSSTDAQTAYRAGLCVECRAVHYSAGRPRCNACHATRFAPIPKDNHDDL